jgi:hypothetical protein
MIPYRYNTAVGVNVGVNVGVKIAEKKKANPKIGLSP